MAKRGPKPKPRIKPRVPLGEEVPENLTKRGRVHWEAIVADLRAEGFASAIDARALALAAECAATVDQLTAEVGALKSLATPDGDIHPLVRELRSQRGQLQSLYGALLMTPRSRSSSRLSSDQLRTPEDDDLGDFLGGD